MNTHQDYEVKYHTEIKNMLQTQTRWAIHDLERIQRLISYDYSNEYILEAVCELIKDLKNTIDKVNVCGM